jgi:broad specificity phosphatase PhoE
MSPKPIHVYLCRHARTALNAQGLLRGHLDPPLDAQGHAEADALGKALESLSPRRVVCSPLKRAIQTAQAVASFTGSEVSVDLRLIDRDYGAWAGRREEDAVAAHGSIDAADGVEPADIVLSRARQVLDDQVREGEHGPVVLVSHDAVNRLLLASLDPELRATGKIPQRTACWNLLLHTGGGWRVELLDQKVPVP